MLVEPRTPPTAETTFLPASSLKEVQKHYRTAALYSRHHLLLTGAQLSPNEWLPNTPD